MNEKLAVILGGTALALTIGSLWLLHKKTKEIQKLLDNYESQMKKTTGTVDKAVKDLAEATPVDIRQEIVDRAVEQAVEREAKNAVYKAICDVRSDIRNEINDTVRREIQDQKDRTIEDVDRKIIEEIDKISKDDIAADVRRKATDLIIDRMDCDMNDIRDKYSRKLEENMKDITRSYKNRLDLLVSDADRDYWSWRIRKI